MSARSWNKAVKRWPGWLALVFVVAGFLAVGAFRSTGPETPADRVDAIAARVACPICDGESVYVSQNNASRAIRSQIGDLVAENDLSDDDIIAFIETAVRRRGAARPAIVGLRRADLGVAGRRVRVRGGGARRGVPPLEA